ncbi:uncharacterized protein LOC119974936 isoform X1 [Scyliorhinus canicula]|uniref:uncharacterized protein LOC119974936 isoform X1 n=1 Tax=Scyliorhinus canicula TaxID=7830 RepID=UPI0018F7A58C|nr:uncharacterized protein LOC119974936 isoform X1 [Scyliorhinus canicula]
MEADGEMQWETVELRKCGGENLYYKMYRAKMEQFPADVHRFCDPELQHGRRRELVRLLRNVDELSCQKLQILFSFSVPNAEAITFISDLNQPVVSAGAGTGYWEYLLKSQGVDLIAFDKNIVYPPEMRYSEIVTSGPEILEQFPDRVLFLAWPDIDESSTFSLDCLSDFKGDIILHVGELLGETLSANHWGQSTSRSFQLALAEEFCCLSRIKLPNWPGHLDSLTMWKRKSAQPVVCDGANFHYVNTKCRVYL